MTLRCCGFLNTKTDLINTTEGHIDAAGIAFEKRCTESHPQERNKRCPTLANGHVQTARKLPFRDSILCFKDCANLRKR